MSIVIEPYIIELNKIRKDPSRWHELQYELARNEQDTYPHDYDAHEQFRYQMLLAMERSFQKETDKMLLLFLFKQEILTRQNASFQGIGESLQICSFLLQQYQKPEYVWFFVESKCANFDTHCGYDRQYLVSAGIEATFQFVEQSDHILKPQFYEYIGASIKECIFSEEELISWHKQLLRRHDLSFYKTLKGKISLAFELEEVEKAKILIEQWKNEQAEWKEANLKELNSYARMLKDIQTQIATSLQLFSYKKTDWDKASALQSLGKLYLQNKQPYEAWKKLKATKPLLKNIDDWQKVGLGRFIMENTMEVVIMLADAYDPIVVEAYEWGIKHLRKMKNCHLNLFQKTADAALIMQDYKMTEKFQKKLSKEQKRIEDIFND